jgi:crossover junction endodeoxyribonuclease RuvC
MKPQNILGIDLSMNATGLAMLSFGDDRKVPDFDDMMIGSRCIQEELSTPHGLVLYQGCLVAVEGNDTLSRWESVLLPVLAYAMHAHMVLIEGYAFSRNMAFARALTEFGGIVRYHLRKIKQVPIEISPSSVKKFVSGKGNADKGQMVSAVREHFDIEIPNHNMADAFGLAQIGRALKLSNTDLMSLPLHQREVIRAVKHPPVKVKPSKENPICETFIKS